MKIITVLLLFIICIGCSNVSPKSNFNDQQKANHYFDIYNLDTLKNLISKDTSEIKKLVLPKDIILKDTTFESDEGASWSGFVFYKDSDILLVVETSWECKNIIQRIEVQSSNIVSSNPLKVGAKFKDIKLFLSQSIPSYPDGYFGLRNKDDGRFTCFFNVDNNYDLSTGNVEFENIPDSLIVTQILIE